MRLDLEGLEITKGELKHLSGVSLGKILLPPTKTKYLIEGLKSLLIALLLLVSYWMVVKILNQHHLLLIVTYVSMAIGLFLEDIYKIFMTRKNQPLIKLFEDVDKYNSIIQAIVINDRIEAAGNPQVQLSNRTKIIEALQLIREDLIRALKTERIIRENQKFVNKNTDLFTFNFNTLTALQINDKASEHGKLLNEALEIAIEVREEMKKLQNEHLLN
ncbi:MULTISPECIES: hypothetical protein [Okeania]|uniref:Uncharacterized protein n=1 Tax=Okeania hirsuta TaxID=1458930 RepID=A0A3N6Q5C6_9CYAN|nr:MULTISPECIES: hypothetical protein [Okeania]NES93574.1 hypothetical protein [Okeania sp. SIO2B9]RQH25819.1 hypothetical protein D4Z78_01875 [Okeania hirsuta]RQH38953.1 hypothetical protein D5R40_17570 [Okeania hirsuta]